MGRDKAPITALYYHCLETYKKMQSQSELIVIDLGMPWEREAVIWEGFITRFITSEMSLSVPYITKITTAFGFMKCAKQIRRGGGKSPSQWELLKEPTEEAFREYKQRLDADLDISNARVDPQFAINADFNRRLATLEDALEHVITNSRMINYGKKLRREA